MSRRPRTVVHFPQMKPRGHRAKYLISARRRHVFVMPQAIIENNDGSYTAKAVTEGGQRLILERWFDGYGRSMPRPAGQAKLIPDTVRPTWRDNPDPDLSPTRQTWTMEATFQTYEDGNAFDQLFGRTKKGDN